MTEQLPVFDLKDPAYMADPFPTWARMRVEAPVYKGADSCWHLTRYEDCVAVLKDRRLSAARLDFPLRHVEPAERPRVAYYEKMSRAMMLFVDPPDHTRLRRLVARAFTPRAAEVLRPRIQQIADELLDAAPADFDLIRDLALPLPYYVIADMIGIPRTDRAMVKQWSSDVSFSYFTPERGFKADASFRAFSDYLRPIVRRLRESPDASVLSTLVSAEEDGDRLTEDELFATAILLIVAGHETTTNLIANALLLLLSHPDQLRLLRANPSLINSTIHEVLRYNGPVAATSRVATEAMLLGGMQVVPGEWVVLRLAAANRDPEVFSDPERFDITRDPNPHLGFGDFIHKCIGAPLALVEGQVVIDTLLQHYPQLRLTDVPIEREEIQTEGASNLKSLPLHLGERADGGL